MDISEQLSEWVSNGGLEEREIQINQRNTRDKNNEKIQCLNDFFRTSKLCSKHELPNFEVLNHDIVDAYKNQEEFIQILRTNLLNRMKEYGKKYKNYVYIGVKFDYLWYENIYWPNDFYDNIKQILGIDRVSNGLFKINTVYLYIKIKKPPVAKEIEEIKDDPDLPVAKIISNNNDP